MTIFDFSKEEQGDWFSFFESHIDPSTGQIVYADPQEGAARFRIRSMVPFWEEQRKGRKKQYQMVLNPQTRAMERVGYYDDLPEDKAEQENDDAWDYAITGIEHAFSSPGVPLECTRENKLKLVRLPTFLRFITRVFVLLNEAGIREREESEKN
ncbi:MAG: hypothetical protein ABIJ57_16710 [Pseudomonadota bacterium]